MLELEKDGYTIYYTDTDCLVVDKKITKKIYWRRFRFIKVRE
jgi:hypothetical protein